MAYPLFDAQRPTRRRGAWLAASAAAHAAVIAVVISSAPRLGAPLHTRRPPSEHIAFVTPSAHADLPAMVPHALAEARRAARHPRAARRVRSADGGQLSLASLDQLVANMTPVAVADSLSIADPSVDLASVASGRIDFGGLANQLLSAVIGHAYSLANPNAIYDEAAVDKIAEAMRENPKPVYPYALRMAGVEASFIVRFVVDTTGRVDERSLEFPPAAQRLLIQSVREALRRSRYFPAVVGGQPVRQLVEQRFSFVLDR